MNWRPVILAVLVIGAAALYFAAGGEDLLDPRAFKDLYVKSPLATAAVFILVCLLGTTLSLPVTGVLSVIAGMTFGHLVGIPIALLACTAGGTVAFLLSRYVLRDPIQRRFAKHLVAINEGVEKDGAFYLFALRMIPIIPFWSLNLLVGLTPINVRRFVLATLAGMLPIVTVLVHFGTQVGALESFSVRAMFTPSLLLSLALVGIVPFVAKGIVRLMQRQYRQH